MPNANAQLVRTGDGIARPMGGAVPLQDKGWGTPGKIGDLPISFYVKQVRQHLWRIVTFVALASVTVGIISLMLRKEYLATAVIRIEPSSTAALDNNSTPEVAINALELMTTEARVITNPAVVGAAIRLSGLDSDPEFNPPGATPALSPEGQQGRLLDAVTSAITVSQAPNSFLLDVSFRSQSPQLAAAAANALVKAFTTHEYQTRSDALRDSSQYMRSQMQSLGAQMETAQRDLVEYESKQDVTDPGDKTNTFQARLAQLNEAYGKAQVNRAQLEADYDIAKGGDLDALAASDRGQQLLTEQKQVLDDQRALSRLGQVYGPNYRLYQQQEQLVAHDEAAVADEAKHLAAQINSGYQSAEGQETLLKGLLDDQKRAMDEFNLKAVQYSALKARSDSLTTLYYNLQQRIQDAAVGAGLHSEDLRLVSEAQAPTRPVFPRPLLMTAAALLFSTVLGIGLAVLAGFADRTISTAEQAEQLLDLPVLGTLPLVDVKAAVNLLAPRNYGRQVREAGAAMAAGPTAVSSFHESVLSLRSALMIASGGQAPVLAIASSMPSEGKSTISANLAAAIAGLGGRVVLVDADLRKSNVHRLFGQRNRVGLSNVLRGEVDLQAALVPSNVAANLTLLLAGRMAMDAAQLLHTGFEEVIAQLREQFEYVVVDCPPVLGFADSLAVAAQATGMLLVLRAGITDRAYALNALRQLRSINANLLGVALNGVSHRGGGYYGYYSGNHYSKYYRAEPEEEEVPV